MRFDVDCDQKGKVVGIVGGGLLPIRSSGQTNFSFPHIENITLGGGKEVDEIAGGANAIGVDRRG